MGIISPAKLPRTVKKRDGNQPVELYAKGGETKAQSYNTGGVAHASKIDGGVFVAAASKHGLGTDIETLNKIVRLVNEGLSVDAAAQKVAKSTYAKGGETKVNEAGNYTKPEMRKALFNSIKGQATQGTAAGQWSARKAQMLAKQYKAKGGGYRD